MTAGIRGWHTRRVAKARRVIFQDLKGEAVLLNLENGRYYGLDKVGCRMYKLLVVSKSIQAAFDTLLAEYEVEPRRLRRDLTTFLQHLQQNGLITDAQGEES